MVGLIIIRNDRCNDDVVNISVGAHDCEHIIRPPISCSNDKFHVICVPSVFIFLLFRILFSVYR